jgi:formylmethanofuran dehydrogenase subunit E
MARIHLAVRCKNCGEQIITQENFSDNDTSDPERVFVIGVAKDLGPLTCKACGETHDYMAADIRNVVDNAPVD